MVAVLHGAVVGGGLEIAAACHIRVAEPSAYYALLEAARGIFVGGGRGAPASPHRHPRMTDMMRPAASTSRGKAVMGHTPHYLVAPGRPASPRAIELAKRIAGNAPMTNFAVTHVLPRIAESIRRAAISPRR